MRVQTVFHRMDAYELKFCEVLNRGCRRWTIRKFFAAISRLGDGVFWYALMVLLPLVYGSAALAASLHMGFVALTGLALYKYLKERLVRQRPYITRGTLTLGTAPLDVYSFPSGHTLHAVAFTSVALAYFPQLGWVLIPFAILVALSRVVLGLHYPTDVLAGAVIGALLARISFALIA